MATLSQCYLELRARRARLLEAETNGWRDCARSERNTVAEFEDAFMRMVMDTVTADRLMQQAGEVELGPLPWGVSLAYSSAAGQASAAQNPTPGLVGDDT